MLIRTHNVSLCSLAYQEKNVNKIAIFKKSIKQVSNRQ